MEKLLLRSQQGDLHSYFLWFMVTMFGRCQRNLSSPMIETARNFDEESVIRTMKFPLLGKKEYFVNCQEQRGVTSLTADLFAAGRTKPLSYEI